MAQENRPVAADAALAIAVLGVRTGLRAAGAVADVVAPVTSFVLRPENWPSKRLRDLAETGYQQRQRAIAEAARLYRKVVPLVVTDLLDQLDLTAVANSVIRDVDLPEIIRASTGSVAAETVRDVRVGAIHADQVVSRLADRVLRPRRNP
ncbi:MAG: hypothetical protein WBA97_06630 [Actinophytocola sp.]|uniref:hypothetical protein n=1 Tax=Actinophytocola sp. TaxID=1872138 RepID=UPI003C7692BB